MHGDGCSVADRVAPDRLEELFAGEGDAGARHEMGEQVELLHRQSEEFAVKANLVRDKVNLEVARDEFGVGVLGSLADPTTGPPQHGLHTRGQLSRRERLRDVVVGAKIETRNAFGLAASGRQHDHRNRRNLAEPTEDLDAVELWQHQVEDHEIGQRFEGPFETESTVADDLNLEAFLLEVPGHDLSQVRIIVDDKDASTRHHSRVGRIGLSAEHTHGEYVTTKDLRAASDPQLVSLHVSAPDPDAASSPKRSGTDDYAGSIMSGTVANSAALRTATVSEGDTTGSAVGRPLKIAFAIVFIGGLLLRWRLLRSPLGILNSDEAMTGLTTYEVLDGHPSLVIGAATYGSTIEAWMHAPFVALFGGSRLALKIVTMVEWLVASGVLAWALRPILGRGRALVLGGMLWVHSGALVVLSTSAYLGYASGLIAVIASLGFLIRSVDEDAALRLALFAGITAGLAVWGHPLFLVPLVPAFLASAWLRLRAHFVPWASRAIGGGVIGLSPLIAFNIRSGGDGLKSPPQVKVTNYRERLEILLAQLAPRGFGLRTGDGQWVYPSAVGMGLTLGLLVASIVGCVLLARRHRAAVVIAAASVVAVPLQAAFPNTWYFDDARYFAMITVPILTGLVGLTLVRPTTTPAVLSKRLTMGLAVALVAWGVMTCGPWFRNQVQGKAMNPDAAVAAVVDRLDQAGIKGIAGEYWAVYRVGFASDNRIVSTVQAGPDRFPRMKRRFDQLPARQVAYVYLPATDNPGLVPNNGAGYTRLEVGGMVIYLPPGAP